MLVGNGPEQPCSAAQRLTSFRRHERPAKALQVFDGGSVV